EQAPVRRRTAAGGARRDPRRPRRRGRRLAAGRALSGAPAPGHGRVLHPAPGVLAFYDRRVEGYAFAPAPHWVDEGAISPGIASYAIVAGGEALVYDTHVSVAHGRWVRETVEAAGAERITVLLSHWHLDHVAGNEAFAGCEILAGERTAAHLAANRVAIE